MNLNIKRVFNIQLYKRLERNNNKFIIDYIKVLEKKTNKRINNEIKNIFSTFKDIFLCIGVSFVITSHIISLK